MKTIGCSRFLGAVQQGYAQRLRHPCCAERRDIGNGKKKGRRSQVNLQGTALTESTTFGGAAGEGPHVGCVGGIVGFCDTSLDEMMLWDSLLSTARPDAACMYLKWLVTSQASLPAKQLSKPEVASI